MCWFTKTNHCNLLLDAHQYFHPRSVKYKLISQFPHKAGVGWTVPALAGSLVIHLALVMVLVVMYRRMKGADQAEP